MIELAAKIALGTALYVAVLWTAQRNPRAAGMMLTFPTLNGIGLLMAEPAAVAAVAQSMLLMPILNGVLYASYVAASLRWSHPGLAPAAASRLLVAAFAVIWLALAWLIVDGRWGVPSDRQALYALATAAAGLGLTLVARPRQTLTAALASPPALRALVARNRQRIGLFALSLAGVAVVDRLDGPPAVVGVLASLPLVAVFGMHAIAGDDAAAPSARRQALAAMVGGVWLGPAVAIVFVAAFWRTLSVLSSHRAGFDYLVAGAVALFVGWSLCLLAIWSATCLLSRLQQSHLPERSP